MLKKLLPVIILGFGFWALARYFFALLKWTNVEDVLVGYKYYNHGAIPIVRFEDGNGKTVEVESSYSLPLSWWLLNNKGDRITILYSPNNAENAIIKTNQDPLQSLVLVWP